MPDQSGRIPLHYAAGEENDAAKVAAEIAGGADVNTADNQGWTPLHLAAQDGSLEAARTLLDNGADVNAVNMYGNTPLGVGLLSSTGTPEILQLLRDRGADPYLTNNAGRSVADVVKILADSDKRQVFTDLL